MIYQNLSAIPIISFCKGNQMEKKNNMYELSVKQWSPFAGCEHDCVYCRSSFQRQLKRWARKNCPGCYEFTPHTHPERLNQKLPKTKHMQFIFTCSSGDIAFCPTEYLKEIIDRLASGVPVVPNQRPRNFATDTSTRANQPLVVFGKYFLIDAGAMIKALGEPKGAEFQEVMINVIL